MKYIYMYVWCMHKGTKYIVFNMIYFNTNSLSCADGSKPGRERSIT